MKLQLEIDFSELEIPAGCRKPRHVEYKDTITVKIREATPENAPVAFIVHQFNQKPIKVRSYKGQLYREAWISYYDGKKSQVYPFEDTPWQQVLWPYRNPFDRPMTKAECVAYIKKEANTYLIVDNEVYRLCYEPYYRITTFGYSGCGTDIFTEFSSKSRKIVDGYSALDKSKAIKDAITIASERGDKHSILSITELSQGWIDVLLPVCCTRKFNPQHK